MLFNSLDFAIFLPIVFTLYWLVKQPKAQNLLLLIASYVFYGWWDWRFLSLIAFSSLVDYLVGLKLHEATNHSRRRVYLGISLTVNLGLLIFFKYTNFFIDSFTQAFTFFGHPITASHLNIILPVGISFYTFQTLSYSIDIYRKKIAPTRDIIVFFAYVSFFPQLVAGPIERASSLLPQFSKDRTFNYGLAVEGTRQILWGLFKKIVIADSCATYVNFIFDNSAQYSGTTLILGAFLFAFQIYGDFSGYSDIAIGTAKLFGFRLMQNFAFPYFSRDIAEFWRRWHISLSTWFRDYLYIPLGGSRGSNSMRIRNVFIIFIVSGFWHGANWTFIIWGVLHAVYFLPLLLLNKNRKNLGNISAGNQLPSFKEFIQMGLTFILTTFAWIFFRAESTYQALQYIKNIFTGLLKKSAYVDTLNIIYWKIGYQLPLFFLFFLIIEWSSRNQQFGIEKIALNQPRLIRWGLYFFIALSIFFSQHTEQTFIYFQF